MIATRRAIAKLGPAPARIGATSGRRSPFALLGKLAPARLRASTGDELAGRKLAFACLGALAGLVLTKGFAPIAASPLFAAAGWRFPDLRIARRDKERDELIRAALPDALDLLAACALAGMNLDRALRTVAPDVDGPLGVALRDTVRALDVGMRRSAAYGVLVDRAPLPEIRSLVRALERAERYGTSVAVTLLAQAREMRSRRRAAIETAARAAEVKMLFPLVVCFLPAFVILTVAPVVLTALRSFHAK
jgi:tight adherence protein C